MNHGMNPHLMTAWPIKSLYVARTSTLPEHFFSSKIPLPHLMLLLPSLLLPYTHTLSYSPFPFFFFLFFFWSTPFPLFPWSSFFFFTLSNRHVKVRLLYDFGLLYIYIYIYMCVCNICLAISSLLVFLVHTFSLGKRHVKVRPT